MRLNRALRRWLRREPVPQTLPPEIGPGPAAKGRGRVDHVLILDGTMSSLMPGEETNAGLFYKLLRERGRIAGLSIYYEPGPQWEEWRQFHGAVMGRGINRQIRRTYGYLASRYRPGDRIFLIGFSRGAYAVRSLAGVIDKIGLLRHAHATERNVREAYRHYQLDPRSGAAAAFAAAHCHAEAPIEMVGVWDTVKALGVRLPLLWKLTEPAHSFHDHRLGPHIRHGFQALALDETRQVFEPILWDCSDAVAGQHVEQVWFRGAHGDVGGQLGGYHAARPLANIPLVWMLERAERCALELPPGWRARFPRDAEAPSVGTLRGWGKAFLLRKRRPFGRDPSESIHPSAAASHPRFAPAQAG